MAPGNGVRGMASVGIINARAGAARNAHHKLGRFATFTTRAREAGCELRDEHRSNADIAAQVAADIIRRPERRGMGLIQWRVWEFFEDPSSSRAVRCCPVPATAS